MFLIHTEVECYEGTEKEKCVRFQLLEHIAVKYRDTAETKTILIEEVVLSCPFRGRKYRDALEYLRVECARLNALPKPAAAPQGDGLW